MTDNELQPTLYMLAGPNGAGKSTLYETVVKPRVSAPFINADFIQRHELNDSAMSAAYTAARLAEERRTELINARKSFVTESTFSDPNKLTLLDQARAAGFNIVIYHVNVRSPNLSVARVATRVDEGGHGVPEEKIRQRYERNQPLIHQAVVGADRAFVYDNSILNTPPRLAISFNKGAVDRVSHEVPAWARQLYANELQAFSQSRLNPAAHSFQEAQLITKAIGGSDANLSIPGEPNKHYMGPLVGESSLHWIQQTGKDHYVAHFKSALSATVEHNVDVSVNYLNRQQATVRALSVQERFEGTLLRSDLSEQEKQGARALFQQRIEQQPAAQSLTRAETTKQTDGGMER